MDSLLDVSKIWFFEFKEKLGHRFSQNLFSNNFFLLFAVFLDKSYIWEKSCSWYRGQNTLSQSCFRFLNQVFHQSKLMKQPHYGLWTLKLMVSQEWVDGINWIFACWYRFTKIKSWSKIYRVSLVKNGCDQSSQSKINFISRMNRWNKLIFCLLVQIQES